MKKKQIKIKKALCVGKIGHYLIEKIDLSECQGFIRIKGANNSCVYNSGFVFDLESARAFHEELGLFLKSITGDNCNGKNQDNEGEFNWDDVRREAQEEFEFDDFILDSIIELCFCKFCKEKGTPDIMKKHDHGFVCPSCWDERLQFTE